MKTDFLKGLGITEQATIDAIMAENGRDINNAKGDLETHKNKVKELETSISEKDKEIQKLQTEANKVEGLQKSLDDLKSAKEKSDTDHQAEVIGLKKTYGIENGLRDAKAKSIKAVMPFIDLEKVTMGENGIEGLAEQITALKEGESTSFLFEMENPKPSGLNPPSTPPASKATPTENLTFMQAVEAALTKQKGD